MYLFIIQTIDWDPLVNYLETQIPVTEIEVNAEITEEDKGSLLLMQDCGIYPTFDDRLDVTVISMQIYVGYVDDKSFDIRLPHSSRYDHILSTMLTYLIRTFHLEATIEFKTNIPDLAVSMLHGLLDLNTFDIGDVELPPMAALFPSDPTEWFNKDLQSLEDDTKDRVQRDFSVKAFDFVIKSSSPMKIIVTSLGFNFVMNYSAWREHHMLYEFNKTWSEVSSVDVLNLLKSYILAFL